jgi:hypothetical protein
MRQEDAAATRGCFYIFGVVSGCGVIVFTEFRRVKDRIAARVWTESMRFTVS